MNLAIAKGSRWLRGRAMRSFLFTPANEPRKTAKVASFGADVVVLDLEDAVANEHKFGARKIAKATLPTLRGALRFVRINGWDTGLTTGDVEAVVCDDLDGIVIPKVETARDLTRLDQILEKCEAREGITSGKISVVPIVETCLGIVRGHEIATASPRTVQIIFGAGDLGKDLALPWLRGDTDPALSWGRAKIVYDCRAAGLPGPLDGPWLSVRDLVGFERDCKVAVSLGHRGKLLIHPTQVSIANRVFSPDPAEVAFARKLVAEFSAAEARGAASVMVDELFVDYPIYDKAIALIALADDILVRDTSMKGASP